MKILSFFSRAAVVLGCLGFAAAGVRGQGVWNYSGPIYSFGSQAYNSDGASPQGGVVVSPDGKTLYGTTYSGGKQNQGTVFAFTPPSGPLKTLWDFGNIGQDGAGPQGNLVLANGILYGTTSQGGPGTKGVVYCIGADGQHPPYHWLHTWSGGPYRGGAHDGALPSYAGLTLSSDGSTLYGTTSAGGDNNNGTVFAISINGDGTYYQLLHQFTVGFPNDGASPQGGLVLSLDGETLYGTTASGGGAGNGGTVFALSTSGDVQGTYAVLHGFAPWGAPASGDGSLPNGSLVLSRDGNTLYGTAVQGGLGTYLGDLGGGTVFELSTSGGNYQSFAFGDDAFGDDIYSPMAGLVRLDHWFYGTTRLGGAYGVANSGGVFGYYSFSGVWELAHLLDFTGATSFPPFPVGNDGAYPESSLTYQPSTPTIPHSLLYGTTTAGGANGLGTLFVLTQVTPPTMQSHVKPRSGVQAAAIEVAYEDATRVFLLESALAPSGPWLAVEHASLPYTEPVTNIKYFRAVAYVTNPPAVVTLPATGVSANDAMLNGTVVPNAPFATAWFRYGSDTQYLAGATAKQVVSAYMTNAIAVSNALSGLTAGATYHCQLVASNSIGITYGNDQSFPTFDGATAPDVVTLAAVGVTSSTATFTGTVNPNGANTTAYYQYGTTIPYDSQTSDTPVSALNTNAVGVTNGAAMLLPGRLYNFQLVAVNSAGTTYGANQQFVTPGPPLAETGGASLISSNGATIGGGVFPNGLDTTAWFEYGLDTNYTAGVSGATVVGASNLTDLFVSSAISGLTANTNYHYQLVASNSLGVSYGGDESFPTPLGALPVAVTGSASNVTATSALLSGTVNPEGIPTVGYFHYYSPQTGAYGLSAPQAVGSGTDPVPFSLMVTGLAPSTVYNFQVVGTNTVGSGAGFGSFVPFVTLVQAPPTVQTLAASFVSGIDAQLNGSVNPNGGHTFAYFEYGTNMSYGSTTSPMDVGSGNSAQITNDTAFPLTPRTPYYYRIDAYNSGGTNYGAGTNFTTTSAF